MIRRLAQIALLLLLTVSSAFAAAGPEKALTAPSAGRFVPSVAFDGTAFGIAFLHGTTVSYARVDELGDIRTSPAVLGQGLANSAPAIASDGRVSLVTWLAPDCALRAAWVDGGGRPAAAFTIANQQSCSAVDVAAAADRFLVAIGGQSYLRVYELAPLAPVATRDALLSTRDTSEVRIAYANGRLMVASVERGQLRARTFDDQLNAAGTEITRDGAAHIDAIASGDEFIVGFGGVRQGVTLLRVDRNGSLAGQRFDHDAEQVALVRRALEIFAGFHDANDLFFRPMGVDLNPTRRFHAQQAYAVSATPRRETDLAWAAAGRAMLAVYTSSTDDGTPFLAYRVIDPVTMIRPPYTPTGLTVTSVSGNRASERVELRWDAHVEATSFRLVFNAPGQPPFNLPEAVFDGSATSGVVTLPANAPVYEIRLVAESEQGLSAPSAAVTVTTDAQPPGRKRAAGKT